MWCLPIPHVLLVHAQGQTSLGHNQYTGILLITTSEHQNCGTRFGNGKNCKTIRPSSGWCMLLHEGPQAIDVLSHIPHILQDHIQSLAGLWHNQCNGIPFIYASEYTIYVTRSDENCKLMMQSWGWCILLHEEPQTMDVLPPIPHVLCVYGQILKCIKVESRLKLLTLCQYDTSYIVNYWSPGWELNTGF